MREYCKKEQSAFIKIRSSQQRLKKYLRSTVPAGFPDPELLDSVDGCGFTAVMI